jgi:hypothetical protein
MDVLLLYGADLSLEDVTGLTPLEFAIARKNTQAANKIKKYGLFLFSISIFS